MPLNVFRSVWNWLTGARPGRFGASSAGDSFESLQTNELLREIFQRHGVAVVAVDRWIEFPGSPYRAFASVAQEWRPTPTAVMVQLDVIFEWGQGNPIAESFVGIGGNRQLAIQEAFGNFMTGSLHVLLTAFFETATEQVHRELWKLSGRMWHAIIGPTIIRGCVPDPRPSTMTWISKLRNGLSVEPLAGDLHWFRLYFAQMNSRQLELEVLLDNAPYPPLIEAFDADDWVPDPNFYGVRQFMILIAQDATNSAGPPADAPQDSLA